MQRVPGPLRRALLPLLAILTAFLLGAVVIVITDFENLQHLGTDPLGAIGGAIDVMLVGYGALIAGAIGDPGRIATAIQTGAPADFEVAIRPLSETLLIATPFIFVGLGLAVSFRAGLFNLGADGQFFMGGVGAGIASGLAAGVLPPPLTLVVGLLGGTLLGAAYGFVPGFLKARTGAHEVITTLMLNIVAGDLAFLVFGLLDFGRPQGPIPQVPRLFDLPTLRVDYGLFAALATAGLVSFLLFRTTRGFELRSAGHNPTAARSAGIHPGRTTMLAMSLSGGLAGMAGAFFSLGPAYGTGGGPSNDMGYVALALALIAGLRPSGVVLAAILYGALTTGAKSMVIATGIPLALLTVIIAFAVMFVAAPGLIRTIWRLHPDRRPRVPELSSP